MKKAILLTLTLSFVCVFSMLFASAAGAESYTITPGSNNVIFIADGAQGDGSSADSPLKPNLSPSGYSATAQNPKNHLKTSFYQAVDKLKSTGGTVVICGEIKLGLEESYGTGSTTKDVFTPTFSKPIKFTSVYNGVDYRQTKGARILLKFPAEIGVNGESIWENIDIATDGTNRVLSFNNKRTVVGEGVNCYPVDPEKADDPSYYVSLSAGHRYEGAPDGTELHLIVKSGAYNVIAGGGWGVAKTNYYLSGATSYLTLEGTTRVLGGVVGTEKANVQYGGNSVITVNGGTYEGYIYGGGQSSFINTNASVQIIINGGDFSKLRSVLPIDPEAVYHQPKYTSVNLSSLPETQRDAVLKIEKAASGFDDIVLPEWRKAELSPDPNVRYGDANDDGKITSSDVVRLKKYFASFDPDTGEAEIGVGKGADANGDGKISSSDVVRLKKYFASLDPDTGYSPVALGNGEPDPRPVVIPFDESKYKFVQMFPAPEGDKREIVKQHMLDMYNIEWTPKETFTIKWKNQGDFGVNLTYKAGTTYKGMTYSGTNCTLGLFEEHLKDGKFSDSTYYYEEVVGNHCSASMVMAYQQLIDLPMDGSLKPAPVRIGKLMFPVDETGKEILKNPTDEGYTTWYSSTVFEINGTEKVYEAYALLDTGDILYKNIPQTGHTRMVDYVVTVRDKDGNIDPDKSAVYTIEQTNAFEKGQNTTWWIDHKYTFKTLFSTNFMPVTLCTYHNDDPLEDAWIRYNGNNSGANAMKMLYGTVESNFPLNYVRLTLTDNGGNLVSDAKMYNNRKIYSVAVNDYRAQLFAGVTSGTYTLTITAGIGRGSCTVDRFEVTVP